MLRIRHSLFISRMHSFIRLPLLSPTVLTNHREIHPLARKLPPAIDRAMSDKPERANDWQRLHEWEGPQLSSAAARLKRIKIDRRLSLSLYAAGSDIPDCTSGIQAKIVERCFFWHMSTPQSTSRPTQRRHSWVQLLRARWHHIYTDKERWYALNFESLVDDVSMHGGWLWCTASLLLEKTHQNECYDETALHTNTSHTCGIVCVKKSNFFIYCIYILIEALWFELFCAVEI